MERQVENITGIYQRAQLDEGLTQYVECHGTGTQAGDKKEMEAVSRSFCQGRSVNNPLIVSSVKTNIGHLEGSAGVAGFIKGVLVVEKGFVPKHLNFEVPNPKIDFHNLKVRVSDSSFRAKLSSLILTDLTILRSQLN